MQRGDSTLADGAGTPVADGLVAEAKVIYRSAGTPSASLLKRLLKVERGAAE